MKIKELQQRLDYLNEYLKENPKQTISYPLISVSGFSMVFKYFYNEIYGTSQLKIRYYCDLYERCVWYDYIPKNIDSIDASALYAGLLDFVKAQLFMYQDSILNKLRSGAVDLNREELK